VLPDVSAGQGPGTLARIESRRKEGMARFLASWYKLSGLYECRGTNELSDWYLVTLQILYKWALVQCRGTSCQRSYEFVRVLDLNCEHWCGVRVER
jgi:hypothetical protein